MATFPAVVLDVDTWLQLTTGTWTEISQYAMQRQGTSAPVTIMRGRPDERSRLSPGVCTMQWNNRDSRFSPRNPTGPYYGQLGRNTPIRVSVPGTVMALRLEDDNASYLTCPDAAGLHVVGDIDIRIDLSLSSWIACTLASKWTGVQQCWQIQLNTDGTITFTWSTTGADSVTATSTLPLPLGRGVLRVTMAVASGTVTWYTAAAGNADAGPFTQLGNTVVTAATSIFAGTAAIALGNYLPSFAVAGMFGRIFEFELRNGIASTVVAHPVLTSQTEGTTSFADAQSNTWATTGTAGITSRSYRFHGECSSLPQTADVTGTDVWTAVTAGGIWRRLSQGNAPVKSAFRRAIGQLSNIRAYWPCEDLTVPTGFSTGLTSGGNLMFVQSGTPKPASDSTFACSAPLPNVNSSIWDGKVTSYTSAGAEMCGFLLDLAAGEAASSAPVIFDDTAGNRWAVVWEGVGAGLAMGLWLGGGNLLNPTTAMNLAAGQYLITAQITAAGGNLTTLLSALAVGATTPTTVTNTFVGTLGVITSVSVNPVITTQLASSGIGHIFVSDTVITAASLANPLAAWAGEAAGNRFVRLCSESSVPARVYGYPKTSVAMGVQTISALTALLQQCEDADHGILFEPKESLSLGYRTLASMVNQAPAVTASYTSGHLGDGTGTLLQAIDDDQFTVNDWIVTNYTGASVEQMLTDGSLMSTSSPPAGAGDYQSAQSVSLALDNQLGDAAGWLLHITTVNEPRYPSVPFNLGRTELSGIFYNLQDLQLGDYLQVTSPPTWLPPGPVKQLVAGVTEGTGGFFWQIAWQCIPESPYEIILLDDLTYGRVDTDGSTLQTTVASGVTSLSVLTTTSTSPLWTTSAGDFPFDILVSGERMTVTNITGASSPQTFTVTRSVNGVTKSQTAGADIRLFFPPILALT